MIKLYWRFKRWLLVREIYRQLAKRHVDLEA